MKHAMNSKKELPFIIKDRWQGRQGDLLFVRVADKLRKDGRIQIDSALPPFRSGASTPERQTGGDLVLAVGEKTGHAHVVAADHIELGDDIGPAGVWGKWLVAESDTEVRHDEHRSLPLPKGVYLMLRQREFDYDAHDQMQSRAASRRRID